MAEPHVITALVAKRGEMVGLIEHHQKQITRLASDLVHVDATLKLFDPEIDLRNLRAKEHRERNAFFRPGEAPRFLLDTLREADKPLTSRALAESAIATKGLEDTPELVVALQKTLTAALKKLTDEGTLAEGPLEGVARTWLVA